MAESSQEINRSEYDFEPVGDYCKEFSCLICLSLLKEAVELPCAHAMCKSCLTVWERESMERYKELICSTCKTPYQGEDTHQGKLLDRIIKTSLKIHCKQMSNDCPWFGTISEYKDHEKECEYYKIACTNEGCNTLIYRKDLEDHESSECLYRFVNCEFCDQEILEIKKEKHHERTCSDYPIKCTNQDCNKEFKRHEVENHLLNDCDHEIIFCEYRSLGCDEKVKRMDMEIHLFTSVHHHISLVQKLQDKKIRDLEEKLQTTQSELAFLRNFIEFDPSDDNLRPHRQSQITYGGHYEEHSNPEDEDEDW